MNVIPVPHAHLSEVGKNDSKENEDDDGDARKPNRRRSHGRRPRKQNEFACPFFKHDAHKHGGRRGCREYSHEDVKVLLREHIGVKHLQNNDLNGTVWLQLKGTKHLKGADRYKEIYAILFPDDEAGIQNPYFDGGIVPPAWSQRAHLLPNAASAAAAVQLLATAQCLDNERNEKETQIRSHAKLDLTQNQINLEAQTQQLKATADERNEQILKVLDEELNLVDSEMSPRRQAIQIRFESIMRGQLVGPSTTAGMHSTEAGERYLMATNQTVSTAVDQYHMHGTETATPTSSRSTLASTNDSPFSMGVNSSVTSIPQCPIAEVQQEDSARFQRVGDFAWPTWSPQT